MTPQEKPATSLKRRKVQEIAEHDFCWVLKLFDSRCLRRAVDGTHFDLNQGVAAFICNPLAGGAGKEVVNCFLSRCRRMSAWPWSVQTLSPVASTLAALLTHIFK